MKLLRWLSARLRDLFYDPTNTALDIGRVLGTGALGILAAAAKHNAALHQAIDLGPTGLPGGIAAVLGAVSFYIFHDRQQAATKGTP